MADQKLEPFPNVEPMPPINGGSGASTQLSQSEDDPSRRRRKSSILGEDPRGDTGGVAFATLTPSRAPGGALSSSSTPSASEEALPRRSKRRKARSLLRRYVRLSLRHTWLNPLIIVLIILGLYAVDPSPSNPFHACIYLSYPQDPVTPDAPIHYGKGKADFAFVAFYAIVLSFTREFLMQRLIRPLAIYFGIKKRAKQARFMEQFYSAIYFGLYGPFGLYVMSRTPVWYFNTTGMFEGFPHRTHEGIVKAYYLLQASYWAQQGLVLCLMLEKPRKDFKEFVMHHIVTLSLIWLSYRFHFTYMGIAVYITHDISDFALATSKILNYIDSPMVIPCFIWFIGVWAYLRHYINLCILWATLTTFKTVGPFALDWETQQYKCWISQVITFSLLLMLQALNAFWFFLIMRILYRYLTVNVAADERSEDEEEEEDETEVVGDAAEKKQETPQVHLNGSPVSASGMDEQTQPRSRRKG
ncbi:hypothetical protein AAFC00_000052 [Neodothiora populina]|uniref:TLC domain-containing protein n=1 Tax=Neodothiora populina TaxID=2781224 RepID=A0ABR3P171_9PEZI